MRGSFHQIFGVCFGLLILSGTARGELIGLTLLPSPDILGGTIGVSYAASSDSFLASGTSLKLDGADLDTMGDFDISAEIDIDGMLVSGTATFTGIVGGSGPSLLTGDLTDFGFDPGGGDPLEFLFSVTGGDLAGIYGGVGAQVGVILGLGDGWFDGDFVDDFDNFVFGTTGFGVGDVAPIPAPGAALLGLIGMAMIGKIRRHAN